MAKWRIPIIFNFDCASLEHAQDIAKALVTTSDSESCEVGNIEEVREPLDPTSEDFKRGYQETLAELSVGSLEDRIKYAQQHMPRNPNSQFEYGKAAAIGEVAKEARRVLQGSPMIQVDADQIRARGW